MRRLFVLHHVPVVPPPFRHQKSCNLLLCIPDLHASNATHQIYKWSEVLALLDAEVKALILFLLLPHSNNFGVVPISYGMGVDICDTNIKNYITSLFAKIYGNQCPHAPLLFAHLPFDLVVPQRRVPNPPPPTPLTSWLMLE